MGIWNTRGAIALGCLLTVMCVGAAGATDSTPQQATATDATLGGIVSETARPCEGTAAPEETMAAPTPGAHSAGATATKEDLGALPEPVESMQPVIETASTVRSESGAEPTFFVTVPSSVTAQEGAFAIACEINGEITVKVTVTTRNGFKLINGAAELPYALSRQGESAALGNGDVAAVFAGTGVRQLDIALLGRPTAAGTYTDTLTFRIAGALH